jgi:uncharacterized protein DUF1344
MLAIASATGAYAKGATGTIASIDKKGDSITLVDGKTFVLPEGIEAETLKVGEKVTITYSTRPASSPPRVSSRPTRQALVPAGRIVVRVGVLPALPDAQCYLTPALRKSEGDMPASLRNDLLKALSEPKPESMATRSTLASSCMSSACA